MGFSSESQVQACCLINLKKSRCLEYQNYTSLCFYNEHYLNSIVMVFSVVICFYLTLVFFRLYFMLKYQQIYPFVHVTVKLYTKTLVYIIYLTIKQSKCSFRYGVRKHYFVVVVFTEFDTTYSPDSLKDKRVKT